MHLSILLQPHTLSVLNTVYILESFGIERARSTVHNWLQKADRQPTDGKQPAHVAIDKPVIHLGDQHDWLSATIDPDTNEFRHVKPDSTRTTAFTSICLRELQANHTIDDAVYLADSAPWLTAVLHDHERR